MNIENSTLSQFCAVDAMEPCVYLQGEIQAVMQAKPRNKVPLVDTCPSGSSTQSHHNCGVTLYFVDLPIISFLEERYRSSLYCNGFFHETLLS